VKLNVTLEGSKQRLYTFFWAGLGSSWPKLRVASPGSRYELLNRHLVLLLNK
jgi:hypothetical protein